MPVSLISQAEYARHRGCSQAAVNYAVKAGRIKLVDGKVDPVEADRQWASNSRARPKGTKDIRRSPVKLTAADAAALDAMFPDEPPAKARPAPPPSPPPAADPIDAGNVPDYQESRARREAAEADLAELKVRQQRGQLVEAAAVRAEFSRQMASVRDALLNIPARLAPVLAAESSLGKVQTLIDGELRAVLAQLAEAD